MKIVQVNKFFYIKGGSERYFFDVSTALQKAGHEVIHFSMRHPQNKPSPYESYFIDEVDFSSTKGSSVAKAAHYIWSTEAERKFAQLLADTQPDIIHVHNIAHQLTPSILRAARRAGVPVVHTLHDYQLLCPNYKLFTQGAACERCKPRKYINAIRYNCVRDSKAASALAALEMGFHNILLKSYERGVSKFIAPSQFLYNKLLDWGWSKEQVTYLPHFVEKEPMNLQRKQQIVFAGRLVEEKGVQVLLAAAHILQQRLPELRIVIAGTGPLEDAIREQIQSEGLTNVDMRGFVHGTNLDTLIAESLALVVPSVWYENAPMSIYESLAIGTPVIGSNSGGIPELITEGVHGYVFEPGNIEELAKKVEMLYASTLPGLPKNIFTPEAHIAQLLDVYAETIKQNR